MSVVYRIKCPHCKTTNNIPGFAETVTCPSCKAAIPTANHGFLDLYRMGSFYGVAVGFGIYIDGDPYGYVANKQTIRFILPYGKHILHVACGMNRACNDLEIGVHEFKRIEYTKVYMKPGFWVNKFVLQYAKEADMSEHDPVPGGKRIEASAVAGAQPLPAYNAPVAASVPMPEAVPASVPVATSAPMTTTAPVTTPVAAPVEPVVVTPVQVRKIFCTNCGNPMEIASDAHGMLSCTKCNNQMNV